MRTRIVIGFLLVALAAIGMLAVRMLAPSPVALQSPASSSSPTLAQNFGSPLPVPSGTSMEAPPSDASASPVASNTAAGAVTAPVATTTAATTATTTTSSPSALATIPTPPPGLPPGWADETERVVGGPEAALLVRTGAIDNLGFGWPPKFTPFSGESTPKHLYICTSRPGAAPGTNRSMLGTGVTANDVRTRLSDGYSHCSARPDNIPQAIPLAIGTLPASFHHAFFQMFLDDFQAPSFKSHFEVTLNGTRIPNFEQTINKMDQTGPIGKLVTLPLLPEYWPILRSGSVNLYIDDPTTGAPDGYAVNFVRVLVDPGPWKYAVTIACTVVDVSNQKPIAGASVSAAEISTTTSRDGTCNLKGVPAGLVTVGASAVGYDSQVQLLDLPAGKRGVALFALHRHTETIADLKNEIQKNGAVAIYGIHFDTASAKIRPDSLASLNTLAKLINSSPSSHWIIAGHTDNQGGAAYNLALSLARAHSVVAWLNQHRIPANHLTAQGYGLTRPVADNATVSGRALNRRVEVSIAR